MHLDNLLNQLQTNSILAQVINPAVVQSQAVDSAKLLKSIIGPLVSGGCHPSVIPEKSTYPASAYEPTASSRWGDEDFEMLRTDTFVVTVYDKRLSTLIPLVESIKDSLMQYQLVDNFGAIEVANVVIGFDEERDYRVAAIEVEITHATLPIQTAPLGFVYYNSINAAPSQTLDVSRQQGQYSFSVTVICLHSDLQANRLSLKQCLGGYSIEGWPIGYVGGNRITNVGQFVVWRESFQYSGLI